MRAQYLLGKDNLLMFLIVLFTVLELQMKVSQQVLDEKDDCKILDTMQFKPVSSE